MDQPLHFVTLGVADVARARRFYVDGLGWTPQLDVDEVCMVQAAPGVLLALWSADALAADVGVDADDALDGTGRVSLAHNMGSPEEVDAFVERMVAAGGTVLKPPGETFFGYHAYVADPDGFRWEIAHNPGWRIGDDGVVHIGPA